jgi:hypothetical protein
MLVEYMKYLLRDESNIFSKYTIIHVAGHAQTVDLMDRNKDNNFLGTVDVICILDGDQSNEPKYLHRDEIVFIPFESIEKDLYQSYENDELNEIIDGRIIDIQSITNARNTKKKAKALYHSLIDRRYMTNEVIFDFINNKYSDDVEAFKIQLTSFLN